MKVHVTGIGWVTPTNSGRRKDLDFFSMSPGPLPEIPLKGLGPAARRMDTYTRLALAAIGHCLDDAGLTQRTDPGAIGLIAATETACLVTDWDYFHSVIETGGTGASPGLFAYTLPSSFLGEAAILYQLTGPTFIVNEGSLNGIACLEMCFETILLGETDTMLCGIVNPPLPDPISSGNQSFIGALFLALERQPACDSAYGALEFDMGGAFRFNGVRIVDLSQIVHHSGRK